MYQVHFDLTKTIPFYVGFSFEFSNSSYNTDKKWKLS